MITITISTPITEHTVEITAENFESFDKLIDSTLANAKMEVLSHIYRHHPSIFYSTSPTPTLQSLIM